MKAAEGGELLLNAGGEGGSGGILDVAEQVLNADFFCLFCLNGGGDVEEGLARLGAVLYMSL